MRSGRAFSATAPRSCCSAPPTSSTPGSAITPTTTWPTIPAWPAFAKRGKKVLEPADDAHFDLEAVYELAAESPTEETVAKLADIVDMAVRIADCCEDGMLRALLNGTREYALLVEGDTDYTDGKDGPGRVGRARRRAGRELGAGRDPGRVVAEVGGSGGRGRPKDTGRTKTTTEPDEHTAAEAARLLGPRACSAVELTEFYLARIARIDPRLNAVLALAPDALAAAAASDARRRGGDLPRPARWNPDPDQGQHRDGRVAGDGRLAGAAGRRRWSPMRRWSARLRAAGLVVLGATNLSEWANFRSTGSTSGWSAVGGQTRESA